MSIKIIDNLQKVLDALKTACTSFGEGMLGAKQLKWNLSEREGSGGASAERPGKFEFVKVHEMFSRDEAGNLYDKALTNKDATRQSLAVLTTQSDVLSGLERDFYMRHRGRIRRIAHEANARINAGSDVGVFDIVVLGNIKRQAQRVKTK